MGKRKITIDDLRRFRFISDPQISPDGDKVAFVHTTINYDEQRYVKHIWMRDTAVDETEQFTYGCGNDSYPRWSPDGKQLFFLSNRRQPEKKTQLYVIPTTGGEARLVTDVEDGIRKPMWAPNSRRILFLSRVWTEGKPDSDVRVIKRLNYKYNGVGIFAGTRIHLHIVEVGGNPKQLTRGEFDVDAAKWSPDGETIALIANTAAIIGQPYTDISVRNRWPEPVQDPDLSYVRDIYLMSAEGGELKRLTPRKHIITDLSWAPGGEEIAFIGHDFTWHVLTNNDIWVLPAAGGEPLSLTGDFDRNVGLGVMSDLRVETPSPGAVWTPNASSLYFGAIDTPNVNIYCVDRNSGIVKQVTKGQSVCGFSLSADGAVMAYTAMDSTHPEELWIKNGIDERQVTHLNDSLLEDLELSSPNHFTFMNELGIEVDGWIIKPVDYRSGKRYPAILQMHGGRAGCYVDAMFFEWQVLAADGYAVIYSNARGSSGYGQDYKRAGLYNHAILEFKDTMDFVDSALKQFSFIDVNKMGVTGGSYGGYMTNWIISHTDRFHAAVTCRTQVNNVSRVGTADGGYMRPDRYTGDNDYIGNMEKHMAHSPLTFVKNVKTPTLIIHSEDDLRLTIDEAEQWFVALKLHGIPTEFIRFPDENHGLSRSGKPKHREERLMHILRWFNKYLKKLP
jgi:acylaminoacyl-peptidase